MIIVDKCLLNSQLFILGTLWSKAQGVLRYKDTALT